MGVHNAPLTIQCRVEKKSEWYRYDQAVFKSISLDVLPGKYFAIGDENSGLDGKIHLTVCNSVSYFFDEFQVGQIVELEVKPVG